MKKLHIHLILLLVSMLPPSADAKGLTASAEALIWNTSQQTSTVWALVYAPLLPEASSLTSSNISFGWNTGFRAGLLYEPENNFWDTKLTWTYYPSTHSASIPFGNHLIVPDLFSGFLSDDQFTSADMNLQLKMNMIDLQVSHAFNPTKSLSLRPSIGIKAGTIYQTMNIKWLGVDILLPNHSTETVTNNYTGGGPSFGIDAKWNAYDNFSLVGDLSAAFMWGKWNNHDVYKRPAYFFGLIPARTITTTMNNSQRGTLMLDYFMGLEWFYKGRSQVNIKLGYEMQYWANQMRMTTLQLLPLRGDLTIKGATCGISIDL